MTDPDTVRMMPGQFVDAYEAMVAAAFNSGGGMDGVAGVSVGELGKADGRAQGQWRVSSSDVTTIGTVAATSVKQVGKTARTMRDERFFRLKVKIDKRLRGIAREVLASLNATDLNSCLRVCSGRCKKIGDSEWIYCPRCGGPMAELDDSEN